MNRIDILLLIILPFISAAGAYFSKQIKITQNNIYLLVIPIFSIITGLLWALISKYTKMSLSTATIIFDTILSSSYFFTFLALGESITPIQGVGVAMAITALILLNM